MEIANKTVNKPVRCGICKETVWLLSLKNHISEEHPGNELKVQDLENVKSATEFARGAQQALAKKLGRRPILKIWKVQKLVSGAESEDFCGFESVNQPVAYVLEIRLLLNSNG